MKHLTIKVTKLENSHTSRSREPFRPRCMWCDSLEHRLVEEKRKRPDDEISLAKKHGTRESKRKEMDAKVEKGKYGPSFKLMSDIEKDTDLKKILETRILDSRVEFTLSEVLVLQKRNFVMKLLILCEERSK